MTISRTVPKKSAEAAGSVPDLTNNIERLSLQPSTQPTNGVKEQEAKGRREELRRLVLTIDRAATETAAPADLILARKTLASNRERSTSPSLVLAVEGQALRLVHIWLKRGELDFALDELIRVCRQLSSESEDRARPPNAPIASLLPIPLREDTVKRVAVVVEYHCAIIRYHGASTQRSVDASSSLAPAVSSPDGPVGWLLASLEDVGRDATTTRRLRKAAEAIVVALVQLASRADQDANAAFMIRLGAVSTLFASRLLASPSEKLLLPWDQLGKAAHAAFRALMNSAASETTAMADEFFQALQRIRQMLLEHAQDRRPLEEATYLDFCKLVGKFGQRSRHAGLLHYAASAISPREPADPRVSDVSHACEVAHAALRDTALPTAAVLERLANATSRLRPGSMSAPLPDQVERLRSAVIRSLNRTTLVIDLRAYLLAYMAVVEALPFRNSSTIGRAAAACIAVCASGSDDAHTGIAATAQLQLLARTESLLRIDHYKDDGLSPSRKALAKAYFNTGFATLRENAALAKIFLESACALLRDMNGDDARGCAEALSRYLAVLARCHADLGDRQEATRIYLSSIASALEALDDETIAASVGADDLRKFAALPAILSDTIDRFTRIAIFELRLATDQILLQVRLPAALSPSLIGIAVEMQAHCLEGLGHKQAVHPVLAAAAQSLQIVYDFQSAPQPFFRAQSTRLALLFVNLGVNADRIAEAADAILLNADDGRDAYYIAVARISLAILAQERSAATASTDAALAALQTVDALVPTSAFSACDSALDDADALAHLLARQTLRNNEIIPEPSERLTAFMLTFVNSCHFHGDLLLTTRTLFSLLGFQQRSRLPQVYATAQRLLGFAFDLDCLSLAHEVVMRTDSIRSHCVSRNDAAFASYMTTAARVAMYTDDMPHCLLRYEQGVDLLNEMGEDANQKLSGTAHARMRVHRFCMLAQVATNAAYITSNQQDASPCRIILQASRLLDRAYSIAQRLEPAAQNAAADDDDPFAPPTASRSAHAAAASGFGGTAWTLMPVGLRHFLRISKAERSQLLLQCQIDVGRLHLQRGLPRQADAHLKKGADLAESIGASAWINRFAVWRAEVAVRCGLPLPFLSSEGSADVRAHAAYLATLVDGVSSASHQTALRLIDDCDALMVDLPLKAHPGTFSSRRLELELEQRAFALVSVVAIGQRSVRLQHHDSDAERTASSKKLATIVSIESRSATLMLASATVELQLLQNAPEHRDAWDLLHDAARSDIALAASLTGTRFFAASRDLSNLLKRLNTKVLSAPSISTGSQRVYRRSLRARIDAHATLAALGTPASADCIFEFTAYDRATSEPKNDATPPHLHAAQPVDAIPHTHSPIDVTLGSLPAAWAIVWLASSADDERLLLCRYSRGRHSSIELPYNRAMLRKDDDTSMRLGDVLVELQTIVASSDASAQRAKSVSSVEQRRSWWKERKELDMRMQELVEHVEQDWLGGFKVRRSASSSIVEMFKSAQTMLQPPLCASGSTLATFRLRCEAIFASLLNDKDAMRIRLNTHHLHALAATSATCDTDELEDWLLTTADALQLAGLPISHDELDLDHAVAALRVALEEVQRDSPIIGHDHGQHLVLIISPELSPLPWESIPCLRGRSVSRLPSLSFLLDRLQKPLRRVDANKTDVILDPGADLDRTRQRFEPLIEVQRERGWRSIVGRPPMELELTRSLTDRDLLLYFGHGGAEQYIRSSAVRRLISHSVVMLWGCSSGALHDQGDFGRTGTPYNYMIGGVPALVANLWDITDVDCDKMADAVFKRWGLTSDIGVANASLGIALAEAREACTLRFLNGAAAVLWGLPVELL